MVKTNTKPIVLCGRAKSDKEITSDDVTGVLKEEKNNVYSQRDRIIMCPFNDYFSKGSTALKQ